MHGACHRHLQTPLPLSLASSLMLLLQGMRWTNFALLVSPEWLRETNPCTMMTGIT